MDPKMNDEEKITEWYGPVQFTFTEFTRYSLSNELKWLDLLSLISGKFIEFQLELFPVYPNVELYVELTAHKRGYNIEIMLYIYCSGLKIAGHGFEVALDELRYARIGWRELLTMSLLKYIGVMKENIFQYALSGLYQDALRRSSHGE